MSAADSLAPEAEAALRRFLAALAAEPASISAVTAPERAWEVHVADSLSGLEAAELRGAEQIADLGSGPGFPGVALAAVLPEARVDLIESVRRKCGFLERAVAAAGIGNAAVVCARSESWAAGEGREAYDAVTARALGSLVTVAELASPLLRPGGALVAWKGSRDSAEEARLAGAAVALAMAPRRVLAVSPYPGSRNRHLHVVAKAGPTPAGLPRRPGMARKRPA